jgi:hypothetical protein
MGHTFDTKLQFTHDKNSVIIIIIIIIIYLLSSVQPSLHHTTFRLLWVVTLVAPSPLSTYIYSLKYFYVIQLLTSNAV